MDMPMRRMAEYAAALRYESLTPRTVGATTRHLIDSVACVLGALAKYWSLSDRVLARATGQEPLETLWSLESLKDFSELTDQFTRCDTGLRIAAG